MPKLTDPAEIEVHAISKVHRIANDAGARQYGTTSFAHKEIVALSKVLERAGFPASTPSTKASE